MPRTLRILRGIPLSSLEHVAQSKILVHMELQGMDMNDEYADDDGSDGGGDGDCDGESDGDGGDDVNEGWWW